MSTIDTKTNQHIHQSRYTKRQRKRGDDRWWRLNGTIRFYGLVFLVGTKIADITTTVVGLKYLPTIVEANPLANHLFVEWGLFTGLTILGFASVFFAAIAAELFGIEVRRRLGRPRTALFAQAVVYAALSACFGLVAIQNGLLIADQTIYMLGEILLPPIGN